MNLKKNLNNKIYVADFETTKNIQKSEVYLSGYIKMGDLDEKNLKVFDNIKDFMDSIFKIKDNIIIYFHNLNFDGNFILYYLFSIGYKVDYTQNKLKKKRIKMITNENGVIFEFKIKNKNNVYDFRCSYQLMRSGLNELAKSFDTKYKKLEMEYKKEDYKNLTDDDLKYFRNDILILSELMNIYYNNFDKVKLTIGSQALYEFKKTSNILNRECKPLNKWQDKLIRQAYNGGICLLSPLLKENEIINCNGGCYDYNSMYPSQFHSLSHNRYPIGNPIILKPNEKNLNFLLKNDYLFIIRFDAIYKIKDKHIACISTSKSNFIINNKWCYNSNGDMDTLTLTSIDFKLFIDSYDFDYFHILELTYFDNDKIGIFDKYIDYWYDVKNTTKGARKQMAKYMLNSLSGKFGQRICGIQKFIEFLNDKEPLYFNPIEYERKGVYIPFICFNTAYARRELVNAINNNYDNFLYCDTDSIHLKNQKPKNIKIGNELCEWKLENDIIKAKYIRQKTYIEKDSNNKYYIKVAGLPNKFKETLPKNDRIFNMFYKGASFHNAKLTPKHVVGGICLVETDFTIKE